MKQQVNEIKTTILKRVPPGDKWIFAKATNSSLVYQSLTEALEAWYQQNGDTQFYIDARKGTVEISKQEVIEIEEKKFGLYGED